MTIQEFNSKSLKERVEYAKAAAKNQKYGPGEEGVLTFETGWCIIFTTGAKGNIITAKAYTPAQAAYMLAMQLKDYLRRTPKNQN